MKVLASDYDGTLRTGDVLSKENIEAIHAFRMAGNAFGIITGRSMETIRKEIVKYKLSLDFLIANNGGIIYDGDFTKIKESFMDFDKALDLCDYLRTLDCASFVVNNGYHRCRIVLDEKKNDVKYGALDSTLTFEDIVQNKEIAQIVVSLEDDNYAHEIANYINKQYDGYMVAYVNVNCIDIVPYGISKGEGLAFIEQYKNYKHDDIYAIGDSFNDISMIHGFHGFCVQHAKEEIKAYAEVIVDEVSDAIYQLL